ncbi:MAG: PorP/SprF family type IX secretion system membrane protein [Saprospiraceae bacterium]|nr:PorP/SprF family type IX secretion system membrane protein [Saprospiraceae bacterium]
MNYIYRKILLSTFVLLGFVAIGYSQYDLHFSQYYMSPFTMNPALTGGFDSQFRIGAIYRDQWGSVLGKSRFSTPDIYLDAPITGGFRKHDWIGIGANIFNDKVGTGSLAKTSLMGSVAYHLAMDKKSNNILSVGLQGGYVSRRFDITSEDVVFGDELQGAGTSTDRTKVGDKAQYFNMNAGLNLTSKISKKTNFNLGVSADNLLKAKYNLISQNSSLDASVLGLRFLVHGQLNTELTDRFTFNPSFIYQNLVKSKNSEAIATLMGGYHLNAEKNKTLRFGLGYRIKDAAFVVLGMDYKNFRVGVSYDVNVSLLNPVSRYNGGFEVALAYYHKFNKKPNVKPVIFCPRF